MFVWGFHKVVDGHVVMSVAACRRLWQNLGDMPSEQAKVWFVQIVTDIAPAWRTPLRTNSALLVRETVDIYMYYISVRMRLPNLSAFAFAAHVDTRQ
jgi:hypothetical protein